MPDADFLQNRHLCPLLGGSADSFCSARAFPSLTDAVEKSLFTSLNANFPSCRCGSLFARQNALVSDYEAKIENTYGYKQKQQFKKLLESLIRQRQQSHQRSSAA
jgi:hypothetical protein